MLDIVVCRDAVRNDYVKSLHRSSVNGAVAIRTAWELGEVLVERIDGIDGMPGEKQKRLLDLVSGVVCCLIQKILFHPIDRSTRR
jgi:hypothetical protein